MIAIVTILLAFPLGYFVRSRLAASTAYGLAYLWAFVFQTLYLVLQMLDGGKNPAFETDTFPLSYGIVTLAIFVVGFGLVNLGHWAGHKARARSSRTGTSETATSGKTAASANIGA
jgi:hypothetical protein